MRSVCVRPRASAQEPKRRALETSGTLACNSVRAKRPMPKAKNAPPPVAPTVKAAPSDDLEAIADLLSTAVPRLQEAARALRAQENNQREAIQELTLQSAAKDARIAQLEALVAEADARSERSRAIHAEFEKRLLEEQQRWQATLQSSQGRAPTLGVSATAASPQTGKRHHGNKELQANKSPLLQRPTAQNSLLPERPATHATPRGRPSTTPSAGTNASSSSSTLANAPAASEEHLALPAPRGSKQSPPNAPSPAAFRDTTLKTMATPRTRAVVSPAGGVAQSGAADSLQGNQTPRSTTPSPGMPKFTSSPSPPLGSVSTPKGSRMLEASSFIASANSQRASPAGSAPDTPGRSSTSNGATPPSSRGTTISRPTPSITLGVGNDLLKA